MGKKKIYFFLLEFHIPIAIRRNVHGVTLFNIYAHTLTLPHSLTVFLQISVPFYSRIRECVSRSCCSKCEEYFIYLFIYLLFFFRFRKYHHTNFRKYGDFVRGRIHFEIDIKKKAYLMARRKILGHPEITLI